MTIDLSTIGPMVAYEREDGSMALSTWIGETKCYWAKLDRSGNGFPHIIEAVEFDRNNRPEGMYEVICFKEWSE